MVKDESTAPLSFWHRIGSLMTQLEMAIETSETELIQHRLRAVERRLGALEGENHAD